MPFARVRPGRLARCGGNSSVALFTLKSSRRSSASDVVDLWGGELVGRVVERCFVRQALAK